MVPAKGFSGTRAFLPNSAGSSEAASYFQMFSAGSLKSSASRPKPGMFAVQPKPDGLNISIVTFSASPGSAPSTKIGPVTGLTLAKSSLATSATVLSAFNWPPAASRHWNSMVEPGATRSAGAKELSQPKW